jgi:excisionase family DNA binding protein
MLAQFLPCKWSVMKRPFNPSERLLTLDEVAEELGVDRMTVYYRLLSHENLPAFKVGKRWLEKIEDCLMKNANEPQEVNTDRQPARSIDAPRQRYKFLRPNSQRPPTFLNIRRRPRK